VIVAVYEVHKERVEIIQITEIDRETDLSEGPFGALVKVVVEEID
jgi:hypothetical protein